MKKVLSYLIVLFSTFVFVGTIKANTITKIDMDIYIDKYGTGHVKETWDTYLEEGTEGYKSYRNLGNANLTNLKVSSNDKEFEIVDNWDSDLSFDEKAYKAGLHDIDNGVELCFGISEYGSNIYTITYDIEGFVADLNDSQIIYWELLPSELASYTDNVEIKIHADEPFKDTLPVWGYGNKGGYAYVYDGNIEMSNYSLASNEYMTILVEFDDDTFETPNVIDNNFEYYYNRAEEGADHYVESKKSSIVDIIFGFISFMLSFGVWIILLLYAIFGSKPIYGTKNLKFSKEGRKLPKGNDLNMFRDLPCGKDIKRAYWIAGQYGLMKKKTDFLGAILLKWIKEDKVKVVNETKSGIFKKEDTKIIFNAPSISTGDENEENLYKYMYEASKDGILENKEFETWCKKHYTKMVNWFDRAIDSETEILMSEGKINKVHTKGMFSHTEYQVDDIMRDEAIKMAGLKKFFKEFDNMSDKEAIDVKLWEEYLIYAQIFGIADKVLKQFKKLYPDIITDYDYNTFVYINHVSYSGISSANTAYANAHSYSSGGGGFSSGGGGGGSFGGGGGGGFR